MTYKEIIESSLKDFATHLNELDLEFDVLKNSDDLEKYRIKFKDLVEIFTNSILDCLELN